MKITFLTLFPEQYNGFINTSIIKRAISKRTVERAFISLQEKSMIIRSGSKRDGKWVVIK